MTRLCQIIQLVRLEKAFKPPCAFMNTAPPPCSPLNCLQVAHPQGFGTFPEMVMPISLDSLCQCFTTLSMKKFSLISSLNLLRHNLNLFLLVWSRSVRGGQSSLGFFKDDINRLKVIPILTRIVVAGRGWNWGMGRNKLNNPDLLWQLLEMDHMQPLRPERPVWFWPVWPEKLR